MSSQDLERVVDMVNGYRQTCLLVAAAQTGLIDRVDAGAADAETLAQDLNLNLNALQRLLRALQSLELVTREPSGIISLSPAGQLLRKEGFGAGLRAWTDLVGGEYLRAWGSLSDTLKTGEPAFEREFGMTVWEHRRLHPALNESFQRVTSGEQRRTLSGILRSYTFPTDACLVDVGGGHGGLLLGILKKYPQAQGILFDLPQVVQEVQAQERFRVVSGSFFEAVPKGGDIHLLKHVLHNWDDSQCVSILGNCREALNSDGKILILENLITDDDQAQIMMDIHMMAVLGGRERTVEEYSGLLTQAGLELVTTQPTRAGAPVLMEAKIRS
jgi:O-methyltransferase domain/Dimerisation domain